MGSAWKFDVLLNGESQEVGVLFLHFVIPEIGALLLCLACFLSL